MDRFRIRDNPGAVPATHESGAFRIPRIQLFKSNGVYWSGADLGGEGRVGGALFGDRFGKSDQDLVVANADGTNQRRRIRVGIAARDKKASTRGR